MSRPVALWSFVFASVPFRIKVSNRQLRYWVELVEEGERDNGKEIEVETERGAGKSAHSGRPHTSYKWGCIQSILLDLRRWGHLHAVAVDGDAGPLSRARIALCCSNNLSHTDHPHGVQSKRLAKYEWVDERMDGWMEVWMDEIESQQASVAGEKKLLNILVENECAGMRHTVCESPILMILSWAKL